MLMPLRDWFFERLFMRPIFLLVAVFAFASGCGKKKPDPPVVVEDAPGPETPEPAEPSERDTLLATLKSKRGDSQREAADSLAALAETDEATRDALLELLRDKTTDGAGKTHPTKITSLREAAAFTLMRASLEFVVPP